MKAINTDEFLKLTPLEEMIGEIMRLDRKELKELRYFIKAELKMRKKIR